MTLPLEGYAPPHVEAGEQGSVEWLQSRVGHCTASRFKDVMDFTKAGKEGAKRAGYRMEVLVERLTGASAEHFVNAAMEWGTQNEPLARIAYEAYTGNMVIVPAFIHHTAIKWCGGSPDGFIDDDGMVEFKCPNSGTHIKTLIADECEHLPQIHGLLWITGRQWCDFVSYDPRLPAGLQLYVKRIPRDDTYIAELAANVVNFLAEVDVMHQNLLARMIDVTPPATDEPIPALEL